MQNICMLLFFSSLVNSMTVFFSYCRAYFSGVTKSAAVENNISDLQWCFERGSGKTSCGFARRH